MQGRVGGFSLAMGLIRRRGASRMEFPQLLEQIDRVADVEIAALSEGGGALQTIRCSGFVVDGALIVDAAIGER